MLLISCCLFFLSFRRLSFCAILFIEVDLLCVAALVAGYICSQLCPFVLLPFAKRILTWNVGINAGAWDRSAPRLASSAFKWALFKLNSQRGRKERCFLTIPPWSFSCTRQPRYFCPRWRFFTFSWASVNHCSISRFTRVTLVSAGGQLLWLKAGRTATVVQKTSSGFLHLHWQQRIWPASYKWTTSTKKCHQCCIPLMVH